MTADRVREFLAWIIQDEASMDRMCRMFAQVKESLKFDTVVLAADGYTAREQVMVHKGDSPAPQPVQQAPADQSALAVVTALIIDCGDIRRPPYSWNQLFRIHDSSSNNCIICDIYFLSQLNYNACRRDKYIDIV